MEENILLNIEFNNDYISAAVKNITESRRQIDNLIEANKKLVAQGEKNSSAYVQNEQAIKKLNTEVANNSKVIQANTQANEVNANAIDALKKKNSELLKERNKLDTSTEEGRKKIQELNAEYDKNSKIIADNSTKVEQQRFNIGNYKSALEGAVPGVASFTKAQETAIVAANGFKLALGPVGLIIGAITIALGLLLKSFFGTQEGMDKLSSVTRVFGAILDRITGVLQELGGKVFKQLGDAIKNPIQAFKDLGQAIVDNVIKRFEALALFGPAIKKIFSGDIASGFKDLGNAVIQAGTGIENGIEKIQAAAQSLGDFVDEAVAQGQRLDELQKQIERAEINQIKRSKELELVIKQQKAIVEDITKSFKEREDAALKAQNAQSEALNLELSLLDKRIEKMKLQQSLNDTSREDEKELAELEAKKLELQAKTTEQGIEFSKKIIEIRKAQSDQEIAIAKNTSDLRLELLDDEETKTVEKIKSQISERITALKGTEEQISEQRLLLQELQEQQIQEVRDKYAEDARAKREEELKKQQEFEKGLLDQALIDFQEYTQELINEKKRELLEGKISIEEYNQEISDLELATLETQYLIKEQAGEQDLALQGRITDYKIALGQKEVEAKRIQEEQKINAVKNGLGVIASAFNKQSVAYKVLASAQTLINTYQSAIAAFNSLANIPYVGTVLGAIAAAAATASGLAAVSKINSTQMPKLEEGGMIEIGGRRHSQGGEKVSIGGRQVAEVEGGETMVVLKRGASPLLRSLSSINKLVGGVDFYGDRAPRRHLADGGFVARSAATRVQSDFQIQGFADAIAKVKVYTALTDIQKAESNQNRAIVTSELS